MAIEQGWTKQLAYYLHIVSLHKNGVIYNYTSRRLASKLNKNHSTVNTQVNFLIKKGLFEITPHKALKPVGLARLKQLVSNHTGKATGKGKIKIKIHEGVKYTEWNICARVAINSYKRQQHQINKKTEVNAIRKKLEGNAYVTRKEYARFQKREQQVYRNTLQRGLNTECYLSDVSLSKLLGKSVGTVRAMVKFWQSQGLLAFTTKPGALLETHLSLKSYTALKENRQDFVNTFYRKGRVFQFPKRAAILGGSMRIKKPYKPSFRDSMLNNKTFTLVVERNSREQKSCV